MQSGALDELTLTTNGSLLSKFAAELAACGVRRINVSLDTLDAERFRQITRWGEIDKVLDGISAAQAAGLRVKINAVALKNINEDEIPQLIEWAHGEGMDLTLIEVMPLGDIGPGRVEQYLPLSLVRSRLEQRFTLTDLDERTGGPARYTRVRETGGKLGFITPLTHNFCESCNRVRITCTGTIHTCLGQEDAARSPPAAAGIGRRRSRQRRHRPGDRHQAEGPRLHHRPPPQPPERQPPHERDRRLGSAVRLKINAPPDQTCIDGRQTGWNRPIAGAEMPANENGPATGLGTCWGNKRTNGTARKSAKEEFKLHALLRVSGAIDAFSERFGKLLSWLVVAAVAVSSINAVVRKLFDMSSNSFLELQWVLFSIIFLLCSPWTLLKNEHIRIDIINHSLPLKVRSWIDMIGHVFFPRAVHDRSCSGRPFRSFSRPTASTSSRSAQAACRSGRRSR